MSYPLVRHFSHNGRALEVRAQKENEIWTVEVFENGSSLHAVKCTVTDECRQDASPVPDFIERVMNLVQGEFESVKQREIEIAIRDLGQS